MLLPPVDPKDSVDAFSCVSSVTFSNKVDVLNAFFKAALLLVVRRLGVSDAVLKNFWLLVKSVSVLDCRLLTVDKEFAGVLASFEISELLDFDE